MEELRKLPNIGKVLESKLNQIGVNTAVELREMGSKDAFIKVKMQVDPDACINELNAYEGTIQGIRKTELSKEKKQELLTFYNALK